MKQSIMEKQPKSALKKLDTKKRESSEKGVSSNRKVHFASSNSSSIAQQLSEVCSDQRKRQTESTQHLSFKKAKLHQTVQDLHITEEILLGTETRVKTVDVKVEQTAEAMSQQAMDVTSLMCNILSLDNRMELFLEELDHAERHMEKCVDELDLTPLIRLQEEAIAAEKLWIDFISGLEIALALVSDDKLELLQDEMVTIERLLQKMTLVGSA